MSNVTGDDMQIDQYEHRRFWTFEKSWTAVFLQAK